jgi:hypothetical protein
MAKVRDQLVQRLEAVGLFISGIVTVVTFARFVIITHHTSTLVAAVEPVLDTLRPIRGRPWQCPDDHFHRDVTLLALVTEKLSRPVELGKQR